MSELRAKQGDLAEKCNASVGEGGGGHLAHGGVQQIKYFIISPGPFTQQCTTVPT